MARYFFNIIDGDRLIADEEGLEVPDLETALREACAGAKDMLRDALRSGDDLSHQVIQIADAAGEVQASIAIRTLVQKDMLN